MIRKRILLASLLKPVSDTRLYGKIGRSLAKLPELDIHVAGYQGPLPQIPKKAQISFHPVFHFKRLSFGRFAAQIKFWKLLKTLQPDLLVVATHELLFLSWLYCKLHPCHLVYDVQENYFLNLTTQKVYHSLIGKILGHTVRALEKTLAPAIRHFFLAEESYAQELPFLGHRYTVLQNKFLPPANHYSTLRTMPVSLADVKPLRLLYSGTISRLYGVLEAVEFVTQLRTFVPHAELTIIGYCAEAGFLQELKARIEPLSFVTLIGGDSLVPHEEILGQEQQHQVGLLPYRPHPSTFNCIPTKLFEYIGNGLVVIMEENPLWAEILRKHNAGLTIPFARVLTQSQVEILFQGTYFKAGIPLEVFWEKEEQEVQAVISQLLRL